MNLIPFCHRMDSPRGSVHGPLTLALVSAEDVKFLTPQISLVPTYTNSLEQGGFVLLTSISWSHKTPSVENYEGLLAWPWSH